MLKKQINYSVEFKKFWIISRNNTDKEILQRFVLKTESFHLQYDSFQNGNKTNLFGDEMWYFIIIHYQKGWFHYRSETNQIANENISFPKWIVPFQKRQLAAVSETERFRIFLNTCYEFSILVYNICTHICQMAALCLYLSLVSAKRYRNHHKKYGIYFCHQLVIQYNIQFDVSFIQLQIANMFN